jgi:hypothetical protein
VTDLSQSPNEPVSRAQVDIGYVAKLVSYGNIGFLVAALDFAVITLSSVAADSAYHYFVLGSHVDISAPVGIGTNSGTAVRFDQCIAGILSDKARFIGKEKGQWHYLFVDFRTPHNDRTIFLLKGRKQLFSRFHVSLWLT